MQCTCGSRRRIRGRMHATATSKPSKGGSKLWIALLVPTSSGERAPRVAQDDDQANAQLVHRVQDAAHHKVVHRVARHPAQGRCRTLAPKGCTPYSGLLDFSSRDLVVRVGCWGSAVWGSRAEAACCSVLKCLRYTG